MYVMSVCVWGGGGGGVCVSECTYVMSVSVLCVWGGVWGCGCLGVCVRIHVCRHNMITFICVMFYT